MANNNDLQNFLCRSTKKKKKKLKQSDMGNSPISVIEMMLTKVTQDHVYSTSYFQLIISASSISYKPFR